MELFPDDDYLERMVDSEMQIAWGWMWVPDFPTPGGSFTGLLGCGAAPSSMSPARICDPRLRRAVERALDLDRSDPAASTGHWTRIDHDLTDRAEWVWLSNVTTHGFFAERVGNRGEADNTHGTNWPRLWVR